MQWADVVEDPNLKDLPYKIELSHRLKGGRAVPEYPIQTSAGVRVADVVWRSDKRWRTIRAAGAVPAPVAPEICIEVQSGSNTDAEVAEKRALYFDAGALEAWIGDESGRLRFFDRGEEMPKSNVVPSFPTRIDV